MTKVIYSMANGSVAHSLSEAQTIGGAYTITYEAIPTPHNLANTPKAVAKRVKASLK